MSKKLVVVCFINFLIAALMGLVLRYSFIESTSVNYRFLTHAHSHVAMLGWVYLMLFTVILYHFVPEKKPIYYRLFWVTEFVVIGMMLSFPFQGYAAVSISFSTLHILCSYYFVYLIWKHHKTESLATSYLLRASLLFMLLSTLGVWCLGPAVSMLGQASAFSQIAVQFFLHFQFNGWFLIAVLAIFFYLLKIEYSKEFKTFFKLLIASTVLTLALPIHWFAPHTILLWINALGVILQIATLFLFIKLIRPKLHNILKHQSRLLGYLFHFSIFCLILKILLQLITLIPEISSTLFMHRNFVIGFIHLVMLGVISGFLIAFIMQNRLVTSTKVSHAGIYIFLFGFVLTEVLLAFQGYKFYFGNGLINNYYVSLFLVSILLPLGLIFILFNLIKTKTHGNN
ncbi:hypothetical protein ACS386_11375 [Flavobacteriaceae bacterium LMO-SS05]